MSRVGNMFTYKKYQEVTKKLKDSGKFNKDMFWFNIVSPYLMGLGYDIYDLEGTDFDSENKVIYFDVYNARKDDKVVVSCGLSKLRIDDIHNESSITYDVITSKKSVHYLHFNMEDLSVTLYVILDDSIYSISRSVPGDERGARTFENLSKRMQKRVVSEGFSENGMGQFTSIVLAGLLNSKKFKDNSFVEDTIMDILRNPSDELIGIISNEIRKKYFTKNAKEETVYPKVEPIKHELVDVVRSALEKDTYGGYSVTNNFDDIELSEQETKKEEKVGTVKEVEQDKEDKDAFDFGNSKDGLNTFGEDDDEINTVDTIDTDGTYEDSEEDVEDTEEEETENKEEMAYDVFGDDVGSLNNFLDDDGDDEETTDLKFILNDND